MGPEANIDMIRDLEEQIKRGKGDIIKLKRNRNSLLNVSTGVPPEILGYIFARTLARKGFFEGLHKGSYNFLLVCHHWFEVASRTPELWSFWGSTFQDWEKRHRRSGAAPLDLVLNGYRCHRAASPDKYMLGAIRSRVMQDAIRRVHLLSEGPLATAPIISSLTPNNEGGQNENIESIVLELPDLRLPSLDVSDFFARSHLRRLGLLRLTGRISLSSWDCLVPRTTLLTTLSLDTSTSSPPITTAQLLSILISNPNLRELFLSNDTLPNDTDTSTPKVQLCHLKVLSLTGESRHLLGLLRRLILPEMLDEMYLTGSDTMVEDISQTLIPYMRDYFRRDPRFQDRLGVYSSSSYPLFPSHGSISIVVGVVRAQTTTLELGSPQVSLTALANRPPTGTPEQFFIHLIALIPQERIIFFNADLYVRPPEEVFFMMRNIETLYLSEMQLSEGFLQPNPDGPHANMKLLPSLRSLWLKYVVYLNDADWSLLTAYLVHQTSGGQTISLDVVGRFPEECPEIANGIRGLVKEFTHHRNPMAEVDE